MSKRSYHESVMKFGFTSIVNNGTTVLPQCVICKTTLANESMKPGKLKLHFTKVHPVIINKDIEFFKFKETQLKRSHLDNDSSLMFQSSNITIASYEITLLIAKQKKTIHNRRNISENLYN